jgi:serine/threonine protein kinase
MQPPKLPASDLTPVFPHYRGLHEIGYGGFKTVYKGTVSGVSEVLKVISIPAPDDPTDKDQIRFQEECVARVRREVGILSRCHSPFLVKLGSVPLTEHIINGYTYSIYSEEFLDGPDLWAVIKAKGALPTEVEAKQLMRCLLQAIKEIWAMRFIHRDIKPANVMKLMNPDRPFVLIDLGIAFGLLETGITIQGFPRTNRYLAPEMANPDFRSSLDYRTDLYTTALTVFEYAAGKHPIAHDGDDVMLTISRALHAPAKSLQDMREDFSPTFCQLIDQLLKKKPALRPANLDWLIAQTEI